MTQHNILHTNTESGADFTESNTAHEPWMINPTAVLSDMFTPGTDHPQTPTDREEVPDFWKQQMIDGGE